MALLFAASQAAMSVLEQGGVIPYWCTGQWWMHLWYFMGESTSIASQVFLERKSDRVRATLTAITENYVQLPFIKQHRLYVSRVPYEIALSKGESILSSVRQDASVSVANSTAASDDAASDVESETVGRQLTQLYTIPAAKVTFLGSTQFTETRNAVLVMISVVGSTPFASFWRLLSKSVSIAVFITGTALFASATLVSLPMAVMALTLVLSAGVFGRAIAGWMVRRVADEEPMIHVIVNTRDEANGSICQILKLHWADRAYVQVEIDGHVFVNGRRVGRRTKWHVAILGVLAKPYDLLRARDKSEDRAEGAGLAGLLEGSESGRRTGSIAGNEIV